MASNRWEAMPANDGPDVDAGAWQVFRKLDTGEEQWLGGTGDKDEMEWTAEYVRALEARVTELTAEKLHYIEQWRLCAEKEASLTAALEAAETREKTVALGHAVLAKAIADARGENMQLKTALEAAEAAAKLNYTIASESVQTERDTLRAALEAAERERDSERRDRIKFGDALERIASSGYLSSPKQIQEQFEIACKVLDGSKHVMWVTETARMWAAARDGWYSARDKAEAERDTLRAALLSQCPLHGAESRRAKSGELEHYGGKVEGWQYCYLTAESLKALEEKNE